MNVKTVLTLILGLALLSSCADKGNQEAENDANGTPQAHTSQMHTPAPVPPKSTPDPAADSRTGEVVEVLQAPSYTYLRVKSEQGETWLAVSKREIEVGREVSYAPELEMNDFTSKELDRTFEKIYFVSRLDDGSAAKPKMTAGSAKAAVDKADVSVDPAEGGITIGELFSNQKQYGGKKVAIRGRVMKVNPAIMGRNWVHIQDGTSGDSKFDLTVTTQENVAVGDVVTFEGTVALNKDFGAGYVYDVIMEQATMTGKEQ